ncbi:MAG: GyrI-like domain-containing protein [Defluviitaleaceae bacterium]|nr:GyrI-like domain-containing protein [Defluviitaleaceae bacterium]
MQITIENRTFEKQNIMYMPVTLKHEEMFDTARFFMKIGMQLFQTGGRGSGASFIRWVGTNEDFVDLEICIQVEELVEESEDGSIKAAIFEESIGKYAVGLHKGARKLPEDIGAAYTKMQAYLVENNLQYTGAPIIQFNLNNIHQVPEDELLTELLFPVY